MTAGQWMTGTDGPRWWFESGAVSLDFAYTGEVDGGRVQQEQFGRPDDLGAWLAARFDGIDAHVDDRALADALLLRSAIGAAARTVSRNTAPDADAIDTINLFAATPDIPPSLEGGRRRAGATRVQARQALSTIARDAVRILGAHPDRIRECSGEDCDLLYYDESRSGSRRWCAMQRCGNRAKVRAHRARARTARTGHTGRAPDGSA
ncbi:CGNR zinc finger domain-containing protein [Diaminobutyricimonas aerilata]|nr:CGNR zinc finger domain-containing protein [Diaminobutyricimonas aerilata]